MSNIIREGTNDLHDKLEALPFNQKMFQGKLTSEERFMYLNVHREIFSVLDNYVPQQLRRVSNIEQDLNTFTTMRLPDICPSSVYEYAGYLEFADYMPTKININAHIYLNYMGVMFGGQIMAKQYPLSSRIYQFEDLLEGRAYIREKVCVDTNDFIGEVREGFNWHIEIATALGKLFKITDF